MQSFRVIQAVVIIAASTTIGFSQQASNPGDTTHSSMSMDMPMGSQMQMDMPMSTHTGFLQTLLQRDSSGTSVEPNSTPSPMLMKSAGAWMLMFHGNAFLVEQQQSSPRGGDKLFSTNWGMFMA